MVLNDLKKVYNLGIDDKVSLSILRKVPWIAYNAAEWANDYYETVVSKELVQSYLLKIHEYDAVDISKIIVEAKNVRQSF